LARKNYNLITANKSLDHVAKFRYLEMTLTIKITFTKKLKAN